MSPLLQIVFFALVLDVSLATSGCLPWLCTKGDRPPRNQPATASGSAPAIESIVHHPVSGHANKEFHFSPAEPISVSGSLTASSSATSSDPPSEPVNLQRGSHTAKDLADVMAFWKAYDNESGFPSNPLSHEQIPHITWPTMARPTTRAMLDILLREHGIRERRRLSACPSSHERDGLRIGYLRRLKAEIQNFERTNRHPRNLLGRETFEALKQAYAEAIAKHDRSAEFIAQGRFDAILRVRKLLGQALGLPKNWPQMAVIPFCHEHRNVLRTIDELTNCEWRLCGITKQGDAILQNQSGQGVIVDARKLRSDIVDKTPRKAPWLPAGYTSYQSSYSGLKSSSGTDYGSIAASLAAVL